MENNKELIGLFLLVGGAFALMMAVYNAFLAGFGFISDKSVIPWCIVSLIVFFSGLIVIITSKKGA
jgi:hypothetical protein